MLKGKQRDRMRGTVFVILIFAVLPAPIAGADISPICCEDFTGQEAGVPDRAVNVVDLLGLLARWGQAAPAHPGPDIAPLSADGCPAGGDGITDVVDLLALLAAWGPCDSKVDECAKVLDPANTYARISADGSYPFRINGLLDGPQRGPKNDTAIGCPGGFGFTTGGWWNYGRDAIPGGFQFGDLFGIDMSTDPFTEGGDVWFLYTPPCSGRVFFEITSDCDGVPGGLLDDSMIERYPADQCPTSWCQHRWADGVSGNLEPPCFHALTKFSVIEGESFLIRIGGWMADRGDAVLNVSCIDNSVFANALPLDIGEDIIGTTVNAQVPQAPTCDGVTVEAPGHWYKIVGSGVQVTAHTNPFIQPVFDTRISVYTSEDGTADNLTCITAANDDTFDLAESVSWISQAGTTYYLLVHGTAGLLPPFVSEGEYWFNVSN